MKQLSLARLRELAAARELDLNDQDLTRLQSMVRDLLDVAARLRGAIRVRSTNPPE
jgi:hypothetical protein